MMIKRIIIGSLLIVTLEFALSVLVSIGIFSLLLVYIIACRPYLKLKHNARVTCNFLICIGIQSIYLSYKLYTISKSNSQEQLWLAMPFVVCALLLICILYNFIFFVREWLQDRKNKKNFKFV